MLQSLDDGLWSLDDILRLPGGAKMPTRMTVARLGDSTLWVHSPNRADTETLEAVAALGTVAHVVAPSTLHHMFVAPWQKRFPDARCWATPGLRHKRPDIAWTDDLDNRADASWQGTIDAVAIDGAPSFAENAFFHRPSRSLLVADLLFDLVRPDGFMSNVVFSMMGVNGRLAQSRAWRMAVRDRAAAAHSAARVMEWDFARLVPCHGDVVETDAKDRVREALRWMLRT